MVLKFLCRLTMAGLLMVFAGGCGKEQKTAKTVVANAGSDTMVNLAQMWSEAYGHVEPDVSVEVSGGGSGVGIRDLMQGITQIANCSREIEPMEREQTLKNTGKEPIERVVGHDAIAVYVHKDNPLDEITIDQLAELFAEGGKVERWSQLGVDPAKTGGNDKIIRVSRQNSSGTYLYFREHILCNKDFKPGSLDMSGSKDVVELVGRTRSAIGYSGMGYATKDVKMLSLKVKGASEAIAPTVENVLNKKYPLARSLLMYTLGEPQGAVKAYMDWISSPAGQQVVVDTGYVPEGRRSETAATAASDEAR